MSFSQLADDLAGVCQDTFREASPVSYTPLGGQPTDVNVIFDEQHVVIEGDGETGVETVRPAIFIRFADFTALNHYPARGDTVVVRSKTYEVVAVQTDGEAEATLILMRAPDA